MGEVIKLLRPGDKAVDLVLADAKANNLKSIAIIAICEDGSAYCDIAGFDRGTLNYRLDRLKKLLLEGGE